MDHYLILYPRTHCLIFVRLIRFYAIEFIRFRLTLAWYNTVVLIRVITKLYRHLLDTPLIHVRPSKIHFHYFHFLLFTLLLMSFVAF